MEEKITALIEVRVSPNNTDGFNKIAEKIYSYEEISSVYLISLASWISKYFPALLSVTVAVTFSSILPSIHKSSP